MQDRAPASGDRSFNGGNAVLINGIRRPYRTVGLAHRDGNQGSVRAEARHRAPLGNGYAARGIRGEMESSGSQRNAAAGFLGSQKYIRDGLVFCGAG